MRARHAIGPAPDRLKNLRPATKGLVLMTDQSHDETEEARKDRLDRARLDRGIKWFYIGTTLLVAFGGISALFRI